MTKQTTIDQSNVIGTGEEGLIVSKVTSKRWQLWFLFLRLLHCQIYEKI
jgi:hypothetical protein